MAGIPAMSEEHITAGANSLGNSIIPGAVVFAFAFFALAFSRRLAAFDFSVAGATGASCV